MKRELKEKLEKVQETLNGVDSMLVAFSGGIDSTLLLRITKDALQGRVMAVTAVSPSLPRSEREEAVRLAARMGVRHRLVETRELEIEGYRENTGQRCYHCRVELFEKMLEIAREEGIGEIAYGAIVEDTRDHRPGARAADEYRVRSPLQEAGLTKTEIRELGRILGLPNWNKPSSACLASRIPYYSRVSAQKLATIEAAEELMRNLGFREFRVRHHADTARVEVSEEEMQMAVDAGTRARIVRGLKDLGFLFVSLDLEGFRSGSLNAALEPAPESLDTKPTRP